MKRNREGFLVSDTERECTKCGKIFPKTSKTVTLCNECNCTRVKCTDPRSKMFARAKARSKNNGRAFNLSIEDIQIPEFCPVLGIKLELHAGSPGGKPNSPALDRVNSELGYIKGNVIVISHLANMMKSSATIKQLQTFANWVLTNFPVESNELN